SAVHRLRGAGHAPGRDLRGCRRADARAVVARYRPVPDALRSLAEPAGRHWPMARVLAMNDPQTAVRGQPKASASQIRHTATGAQRPVLVLASSIVVAFLAAANAPSPLYERYETAWHASPLIGTIAFAAYAVAVIVGLLWISELPALLGRRAVLLGAIAGQVLALVLFAVASSFALIVVGRVLQGLASGAALGTLSAAMVESDGERGTGARARSPG